MPDTDRFPLVPLSDAPITELRVDRPDGTTIPAVVRRPPGDRPAPVVVFLHGGLDPLPLDALKAVAADGWIPNHFLAAGHTVVVPTRRGRFDAEAPDGWRLDTLAMVDAVRPADGRLAIFGSSGGSDIALELAGDIQPRAIVAEEPATSVLTGLLDRPPTSVEDAWPSDPRRLYTPERRRRTRERLDPIACPVLITLGDQLLDGVDPTRGVEEILIPELRDLGKSVDVARFPGQSHGFAFAIGTAPEAVPPATAVAARDLAERAEALVRRAFDATI
ncbi:MAG: alpha/beta hydrolase [Acidobacteriota bacterium]